MNRSKLRVLGVDVLGSALLLVVCAAAQAQDVVTMQSAIADAAEAKILGLLETRVSFDFRDRSLQEVVRYLADSTGLPIQLDSKALEDASIGPDVPVTCELPTTTLRSALRLMLGRMDLTYVIKNEVLLITTPERAGNELVTRVYLVRDLVASRNHPIESYLQLIDVITATIAPTTWDAVGGPGSIHEYRVSGALVVSQTREVHEQIAPLLSAMRRARDLQRPAYESSAATRGSRHLPPLATEEFRPPERYVINPGAGWLVPRLHE